MDFCYNLAGNLYLDKLMLGISWFGNGFLVPVSLAVIVGLIFFVLGKKRFSLAIILASLIGNTVKYFVKEVLKRPRPGWGECQAIVSLSDYSFPSGHTIFYTIFFGLLAWYGFKNFFDQWSGKILTFFSALMILLIGFSRVYIGAHWLSDVLAGYIIGSIILITAIYFLNKYPGGLKSD